MFNRITSVIVLSALSALVVGCSGGGSAVTSNSYGNCSSSTVSDTTFCLVSCSLGCNVGACNVTDIAVNQPIKLFFSHDLDPASVDFETVSFKTSSGRSPQGRLDVSGNSIEFVPEIRVVGGLTSFGFVSGETYILTLPDASESGFVLKSVTGDSLSTPLSCSLRVSQGIVDLDRAAPKATMISPVVSAAGAPADSVIILEFSEIIDIAGFQGTTTHTSPVKYEITKTMVDPNDPNRRICDPNSASKVVEGLPVAENISGRNITMVSLRPAVPLPSQVCVRVRVTDQVRDLSGRAAEPHTFEFMTKILVSGEVELREPFASSIQLDTTVSSGIWGGGKALPPRIGGTGELGEFVLEAGRYIGTGNHFVFNTDSQVIKAKYTPNPYGPDITVTGGVFEFSRLVLPVGAILEFEGSNIAQIRVRGECRVNGQIRVNGPPAAYFLAVTNPAVGPNLEGQEAQPGGPGGGAGGAGGNRLPNNGIVNNAASNGNQGSTVGLPQGHGYTAEAVGTGGKGSPFWPLQGFIMGYCALNGQFGGFVAAGGGGGGFYSPGSIGGATHNPCDNTVGNKFSGSAPNTGGGSYDLGSFLPKTSGPDMSLLHYAVGGSGGGGGGAHPLISRKIPQSASYWCPGSAGAGGGGVIAFRVGQDFIMSVGSTIEAKGGDGYVIDSLNTAGENKDSLFNIPSPGGGGSGGSIIIQSSGSVTLNGALDTSGGQAGILDNSPINQKLLLAKSAGGRGSDGYFRVETLQPIAYQQAGMTTPTASPKNVGLLKDYEFKGVSQSKWYSTRLTFPPNFLRYEVEAMVDGKRVLYSDDASNSDPDFAGLASALEPIHFRVQGAEVSPVSGLPIGDPTGWREAVNSNVLQSLNGDNATGFRFTLSYDTVGGQKTLEVLRVSVFFIE
jgi:hypothetical protein